MPKFLRATAMVFLIFGSALESNAELIIDTGPGEESGGGVALYTFSDNMGFQWLAGQFSISSPLTLTSAQGWIANPTASPWPVNLSLAKNAAGFPGQTLFTESFTVPTAETADWAGVAGVQWKLTAGSYWLLFEPQERPVSPTMAMPWFAPMPLDKTAAWNPLNSESWVDDGGNLGVRVYGDREDGALTPVPEPSTYGWGAGLLLGILAIWRRQKRHDCAIVLQS